MPPKTRRADHDEQEIDSRVVSPVLVDSSSNANVPTPATAPPAADPPSPHSAPSSPPSESSPLSLQNLCNLYLEEMLEDGYSSRDTCVICACPVALHHRRPSLSWNSANPVSFTSALSAASVVKFQHSPFLKLSSRLPIWAKTSGTVCSDFLKRIELILKGSGIPKSEWFNVFYYVINSEDVSSLEWVDTDIVRGIHYSLVGCLLLLH